MSPVFRAARQELKVREVDRVDPPLQHVAGGCFVRSGDHRRREWRRLRDGTDHRDRFPGHAGSLPNKSEELPNHRTHLLPWECVCGRAQSFRKVAFATSLGGSRTDTPFAIQVDSAGYVHVAGETSSPHFPTTPGSYEPNALIPMWSLPTADSYGSPGGFAAKLSPAGDKLAYSTYVFSDGGVRTMTLDNAGGAYVTGVTGGGVGVTASAPQPCMVANEDAFVTHLDSNGALLDIPRVAASTAKLTSAPPTSAAIRGSAPISRCR